MAVTAAYSHNIDHKTLRINQPQALCIFFLLFVLLLAMTNKRLNLKTILGNKNLVFISGLQLCNENC